MREEENMQYIDVVKGRLIGQIFISALLMLNTST